MNLPRSRGLLPRLLLPLMLLGQSATASAAAVLTVERISGAVHVDQLGETRLLKPGDEVRDRDVVRLDDNAYLTLRFGPSSTLELGPGAALAIERLPASTEAGDLRSIFSLWKGYLRVIWQRPAPPLRWPLYVYFGGQRSGLIDGEYFFERDGERTRACVAAGRLAVTPISGDGLEGLQPSACYELHAGTILKTHPRSPESWLAVRQAFALDPVPGRPLPVFALPEPAPEATPATAPDATEPNPAPAAAPTPAPTPVPYPEPNREPLPAPAAPAPAAARAVAPPTAAAAVKPSAPAPGLAVAPATKPLAPAPARPDGAVAPKPQPTAPAAQIAKPVPPAAPVLPAKPDATAARPEATMPASAAPSPATPGDTGWTILVGSYADPQNAAQVQQKLIAVGQMPFLRVKIIDGKTWNSVQLRGFATREAAEVQLDKLQRTLGLPNLRIVQLP